MTNVLLFVPAFRNQVTGTVMLTTHALAKAFWQRGIGFGITSISNPDIQWVRNFAVTYWFDRQKTYTHLLFLDDDMGLMPDLVLDMIAFGEPLVGTLYPKKTIPRQWVVSGIPNPETRGPFIEVEGLGCGCMLIRRDAVEQMIEKMPHLIDTRPNSLDNALFKKEGVTRMLRLFDFMETKLGTVSEDIAFCRRWRECGGRVWAATHHVVVHVGPHEFADAYGPWAAAEKAKGEEAQLAALDSAPLLKENTILRGKLCKHGAFIYNPNDTFIGRSMEAYGEWCEYELDLLAKFIKEGDTVIDVGANIGTHTIAFSRLVGKPGKVFAFEAQPQIDKILDANVQLNNAGNVYLANKAIGDSMKSNCSVAAFDETSPANFGSYSMKRDGLYAEGSGLTVEQITIDSFAADGDAFGVSPAVIKIDAEGMEADVIRGAVGTIERCKPVLYIDYGEGETGEAINGALMGIDYVGFWSIGPYFNPMNFAKNPQTIWPGLKMLSANLICVERRAWLDNLYPALSNLQPYQGAGDTWRAAVERMAAAHQKQAAE